MKVKPIGVAEGLDADVFFERNPSVLEPGAPYGTVGVTCSVCKRKMRPLALVRPDEPTTKLRVRMWVLRRWLEFPWGGPAFCPAHLPQHHFWWPSFDLSKKEVEVTPF